MSQSHYILRVLSDCYISSLGNTINMTRVGMFIMPCIHDNTWFQFDLPKNFMLYLES